MTDGSEVAWRRCRGGAVGGSYVLRNPGHEYALRFIRLLRRTTEWRAVVYYTDRWEYRSATRRFPQLSDPAFVQASFLIPREGEQMTEFADVLREEYEIRAVIPFQEPAVGPLGRLADALSLSWAQGETLQRFRDKDALKTHLALVDPGLRLNRHTIVQSPREALSWARDHGFARFVLKPSNGFGNAAIGIFDASVPTWEVQQYWSATGRGALLAEEFVGGEEFTCDGQVDELGNVEVFGVGRCLRVSLNGRENLESGWIQTRRSDGRFAVLRDYAVRVVRASGLRRSPFHMEVKLDDSGPCLIECAARLVGDRSPLLNHMHGGGLDVFDVAAHYYRSADPYGPTGTDWEAYDSRVLIAVDALVGVQERIVTLDGVDEAEDLAGFVRWVKRPFVGQLVRPTSDIFSTAYGLELQAPSEEAALSDAEVARGLIRWNARRPHAADLARAAVDVMSRQRRRVPRLDERRLRSLPSDDRPGS